MRNSVVLPLDLVRFTILIILASYYGRNDRYVGACSGVGKQHRGAIRPRVITLQEYAANKPAQHSASFHHLFSRLILRGGGSKKRRRDDHQDLVEASSAPTTPQANGRDGTKFKVTKIIENEGLEWRRNGEDTEAEKIMQQADEGRFDEDLLEVCSRQNPCFCLPEWFYRARLRPGETRIPR
jgi:hypothetical protein